MDPASEQFSQEEENCQVRRRLRTNFSDAQTALLEKAFMKSHYPDQQLRREIASKLEIAQDRVTVWFQNRRSKWRRANQQQSSYGGGHPLVQKKAKGKAIKPPAKQSNGKGDGGGQNCLQHLPYEEGGQTARLWWRGEEQGGWPMVVASGEGGGVGHQLNAAAEHHFCQTRQWREWSNYWAK